MRNANQVQLIGNRNPPNMAAVSSRVLSAASPPGMDFANIMGVNNTASDAAAASCRQYSGIDGLRRLQADQANRTYYDAGCGWRYNTTTGLSQGALGNARGPLLSQDDLKNGNQWFWDLSAAEKTISTRICQNMKKCSELKNLGKNADVCGYCKSTRTVIPVLKGKARYTNDANLSCPPADIIGAGGNCPPEGFRGGLSEAFQVSKRMDAFESFTNMEDCDNSPLSRACVMLAARSQGCSDKGSLLQALSSVPTGGSKAYDESMKTNNAYVAYKTLSAAPITKATLADGSVSMQTALGDFANLVKDTNNANRKLSLAARDLCVKKGAYEEYDFCSEMNDSTVINASNIQCIQKTFKISGGTERGSAYPRNSWIGRRFGDFNATLSWVLADVASKDKLRNARGIQNLVGVNTIEKFQGANASQITLTIDLPANDDTRGTETVWFDWANETVVVLRCDLLLLKDPRNGGKIHPHFGDWEQLKRNHRFPSADFKAFTSAFEFRPVPSATGPTPVFTPAPASCGTLGSPSSDKSMRIYTRNECEGRLNGNWNGNGECSRKGGGSYSWDCRSLNISGNNQDPNSVTFNVTTDDGFILSKNKNPFEENNSTDTWGSWQYQGPTAYTSPIFNISDASATASKNIFITKWFNGGGQATSLLNIKKGVETSFTAACDRKDLYLTQEPLAPWLQYEICSKKGTVAFQEKRWNGPVSFRWGDGKQYPSFDAQSGSVVSQTSAALRNDVPGGKGFMSFVSNSWWHTSSYFHFTAFNTITLLVRPMATLASGGFGSVFHHCNLMSGGYSAGFYLYNKGGQYTFGYGTNRGQSQVNVPATMNQWNLVVIQYVGDENGVRGINFNVEALSVLQDNTRRGAFLAKLTSQQAGGAGGQVMIGKPTDNYVMNSGRLMLGSSGAPSYKASGMVNWNSESFVGDIAWVHGFRNYIDSDDLLKREINQTWISRWPQLGV